MGGVDLITIEAEQHKSCRVQFMHETEEKSSTVVTSEDFHMKAFRALCTFIQFEVIQNMKCLVMMSLLDKYRTEYTCCGGDP